MKNRDKEVIAIRSKGILSVYVLVIVMGIIFLIIGLEEYFRLGVGSLWLVFGVGISIMIIGVWLLIRYLIVPKVLIVREKSNLIILGKTIPICEIEKIDFDNAHRDRWFPKSFSWGKLLFRVGDLKIKLRYVADVAYVYKRIKILMDEENKDVNLNKV